MPWRKTWLNKVKALMCSKIFKYLGATKRQNMKLKKKKSGSVEENKYIDIVMSKEREKNKLTRTNKTKEKVKPEI